MRNRREKLKVNNDSKSSKMGGKTSIWFRIIAVLFFILSVVDIFVFAKVVSTKYLLLIILAFVVLNILSFKSLIGRKTSKGKKCFASIIYVILICVFGIITTYVLKTYSFLSGMNEGIEQKEQSYSVIVLKNSEYAKIGDLKEKNIEYFDNDMSGTDKALKALNKKVKANVSGNKDLTEMYKELLDEDTDAILVEDSYKTILEEENQDFNDKVKVIYTFKIKVDVEAISKDIEVDTEAFNIYVSGIDTYGQIASVSRSDVNMVITVNPLTNEILLTNIPRDYYVQLNGTTGTKDKLTHAGIYGIDKSVKTIEDLLDIEINYYVKVNFTSVESIIDILGGIRVYSKYDFVAYIDAYSFEKGYNQVNGKQALAFARERKSFAEGDRMRGENQQAVIKGMLEKATNPSVITKFSQILKSMEGKFQTNMSTDKMLELVKFQMNKKPSWNVTSIGLNGADSHQYTYSGGSQKLYVMLPSETSLNAAKSILKSVFEGKNVQQTELDKVASTNNVVSTGIYEVYTPSIVKEEPKKEETTIKEQEPEDTNIQVEPNQTNVDIYGNGENQ